MIVSRRDALRSLEALAFAGIAAWPAVRGGRPAGRAQAELRLDAGPHDRESTALRFRLPPALPATPLQLRAPDGTTTPLQITPDRQAWFIAPPLAARAIRTWTIEPALERTTSPVVDANRQGDNVDLVVAGRAVLRYNGEKTSPPSGVAEVFSRSGYIHPLRTPSGLTVTDDYPPDHRHHHGIWWAWTRTRYAGRSPDFWNTGDRTGTVEFEALRDTWSGPIVGGFRTRHRYVDLSAPTPEVVLIDEWDVQAISVPGANSRAHVVIELTSTQEIAGETPLTLLQYRYGGLGFRGHRSWRGANGARFLTSEGRTRKDGHGTRARWCHIGGRVDGRPCGIAILDHPSNARSPQPMRIHPTEPFFNYAPVQAGPIELRPGTPFRSRYRLIVADGDPDVPLIERHWRDFAEPPAIAVSVA